MTESESNTATNTHASNSSQKYQCLICHHATSEPDNADLGRAPGNTQRFLADVFPLWKCPQCAAIHSLDPVDMADIYSDYPLNSDRTLDIFARGTFKNLLGRLLGGGLGKTDSVIDYGCGNGVYLQYLGEEGYQNLTGYDPFVPAYSQLPIPEGGYDCVIANDVIEHVDSPREMMQDCYDLVKPGGLLYVGTADSEGVESMADLSRHTMRLHQPFHRVILTQRSLLDLGEELGLEVLQSHKRSYMDTLMPFSNYRFLDEFNKAHGHNLDNALSPDSAKIIMRKPALLFWALFGYFIPSAYEPAVLWRKPQ
ncbi:MAG: SAM-dependent methyltransferase [Halioglobus sp.]|jgi:SAM-dependent methyltransferase